MNAVRHATRPLRATEGSVVTKAALRAAAALEISHKALARILGVSEASVSRMGSGAYQLTPGDKPFPMPVDVRVGGKIETVAMTDGQGSLALPDGATWTLDPRSKLLRRLEHIEQFQQYKKEQKKKKAG